MTLRSVVTPFWSPAEVEAALTPVVAHLQDRGVLAYPTETVYGFGTMVDFESVEKLVTLASDGKTELLLSAPFIRGVNTHGTGCTYSAAITAGLARGLNLTAAVRLGKEFISNAIANSQRAGSHFVLGWGGAGKAGKLQVAG